MAAISDNLTRAQYAAIGRITCEWAHLEQTLQAFVAKIAGLSPTTGLKITTELGAVTLLNMILALAHDMMADDDHQPPIYNAVLAASGAIHTLRGRRNYYAHGAWDRVGRTQEMETLHFKAEGKLIGKRATTSIAEIESDTTKVIRLHHKLIQILTDYEAGRLVASRPISKRQRGRDRQRSHASSGRTQPSQP